MLNAITIINTKYRINKPNVHFIQMLFRKAYFFFFLGKRYCYWYDTMINKKEHVSEHRQLQQKNSSMTRFNHHPDGKWGFKITKKETSTRLFKVSVWSNPEDCLILKQIYVYRTKVDFITCVKAFALYNDNNHYKY